MPGICKSATTHDVSLKRPDRKKCSADEYAWTVYPCDLRNLLVAARTDASSSTTEITETVDKTGLPDAGAGDGPAYRSVESVLRIKILKSYLGLRDRASHDV